jgi:transposase
VIDVAILSIIRRWHFRDHVSLREIAKRLGVSRNTVRRYIRAGTVLPAYPERHSPSKLDGFAAKLAGWLKTEAAPQTAKNPQADSRGPLRAGLYWLL